MSIPVDASSSDIQLKVMNYNSTAVTRTLSNLLPVGTAAQQIQGSALGTTGDIDDSVRMYVDDATLQSTVRGLFYTSGSDYVGIAGALRNRFSYLMKRTASVVVSSTYQNKTNKTEFGGD